ncbi:hypothetical protein Lal_00045634 [Lupinus albus]|nr:hypothetical protein Lal_00045634 [Lupinus albus]
MIAKRIDLGKVGSSVEVTRGWFDDNIWKEIGDGLQTLFWHDIWVGNQSLKLVFPRLFRLASNNQSRVGDNGVWRDDVWKWDIVWRRSLFGREESLAKNLYDLIHNHSCKRSSLDRWRWSLDASGDYVVKTAYLAQLTHQQSLIGLMTCYAFSVIIMWRRLTIYLYLVILSQVSGKRLLSKIMENALVHGGLAAMDYEK